MKKLVLVLGVIATAVSIQAAQIKWSANNLFSGYSVSEGATTTKYLGTAYLFDAATISQSALFDAIVADATYSLATKAVSSTAMTTAGVVPAATVEYGSANTAYSVYFAILEGDKLYLSNVKDITTSSSETVATTVSFGTQNNNSSTFSATAASLSYAGAGHWQTVPEPTSGLLMLLGMAGLTLRRRRI